MLKSSVQICFSGYVILLDDVLKFKYENFYGNSK